MGSLLSVARLNWAGEKLVQDFGKGNHSSRKSPLSLVPLTSHRRFQKRAKGSIWGFAFYRPNYRLSKKKVCCWISGRVVEGEVPQRDGFELVSQGHKSQFTVTRLERENWSADFCSNPLGSPSLSCPLSATKLSLTTWKFLYLLELEIISNSSGLCQAAAQLWTPTPQLLRKWGRLGIWRRIQKTRVYIPWTCFPINQDFHCSLL